jgi:hypothetical protein
VTPTQATAESSQARTERVAVVSVLDARHVRDPQRPAARFVTRSRMADRHGRVEGQSPRPGQTAKPRRHERATERSGSAIEAQDGCRSDAGRLEVAVRPERDADRRCETAAASRNEDVGLACSDVEPSNLIQSAESLRAVRNDGIKKVAGACIPEDGVGGAEQDVAECQAAMAEAQQIGRTMTRIQSGNDVKCVA